jgi:cyclin A
MITAPKYVPIKEQKRSIKPNAGVNNFPSKRVKITPPQENLKNRSLSSTFQGISSNENIPLSNKRAQHRASLDNSSNSRKSMEVETTKTKKTFSFDSKPYSNDVHLSQFQIEKRFFQKIGQGIEWEGNPINQAMRSILVNWLTEVVDEYKMRTQTLFLSVSYLDRFLQSTNEIHRHLLQLVGVTCLWIAAKFEEIDVPDVEEFVYITDNTYSIQEIISTERYILNKLDYDLACVTIENFLYRFLEVGGIETEHEKQFIHSKFIAELSLTYYPINKLYCPSLVAASIVCIVRHTHNMFPILSNQFLTYTTCTKEQLQPCITHLIFAYKNLVAQQTALVEKYKKEKYKCVATINLRENIEL